MFENEKKSFISLMNDMADYADKPKPSMTTLGMMWADLEKYPFKLVHLAIEQHRQDPERYRFSPVPKSADVVYQIGLLQQKSDGHPDSNEAWAIACLLADEAATVVHTTPIFQAWVAVKDLYCDDQVGARMAFLECYKREIELARSQGIRADWIVSPGHDAGMRAAAIEQAERQGRLPSGKFSNLCVETASIECLSEHLLLESKRSEAPAVLEKILLLKAVLLRKQSDGLSDHERTRQLKAKSASLMR